MRAGKGHKVVSRSGREGSHLVGIKPAWNCGAEFPNNKVHMCINGVNALCFSGYKKPDRETWLDRRP